MQTLLQQQGCLSLPGTRLLQEFLTSYFMNAHPMLPVVNEAHFAHVMSGQYSEIPQSSRISLLVVHAMLFVASSVRTAHPRSPS